MAVYCKSCGARTEIRRASCPVCGADQRKRRLLLCALPALLVVGVLLAAVTGAALLRHEAGGPAALTEPAAHTAEAVSSTAPDADTVYVTVSGTKYHRDGCSHLSDTRQAISLSEASRMGYEPCADCFKDP